MRNLELTSLYRSINLFMMSKAERSEDRVAKNTIFLYMRMLIVLIVNLYTSRIVLSTIGVENYGIYDLVGGVVALFTFMNASLSGATSRFMSYSLGKQDNSSHSLFSTIISIHIMVAVVVVIVAETIGLFLIDNLVIPENRVWAAKITFHLSVAATAVSIMRLPYNASIIAHEDMKVYAYVSVLEVFMKLVIVYMLTIFAFDKLIVYSSLVLTVAVVISLFYVIYCLKSYSETRTFGGYEKGYFKMILSFFSWDLYGNMSVVANAQGTNMVLNLFGGVTVNAACSIANQVRAAVSGFASNFMLAMNPQIIKNYASGNLEVMNRLMIKGGLLSFSLLWFISLPLILEVDYVLSIWLVEVPEHTGWFLRLALIFSLIQTMYSSVNIGIHATGNIKRLSFIGGTILLLSVFISYIIMTMCDFVYMPFIVNIGAIILSAIVNVVILHSEMEEFLILKYVRHVFVKCIIICLLTLPIPYLIHSILEESFLRFLAVGSVSVVVVCITVFYMALDREMRNLVLDKFKKLCGK